MSPAIHYYNYYCQAAVAAYYLCNNTINNNDNNPKKPKVCQPHFGYYKPNTEKGRGNTIAQKVQQDCRDQMLETEYIKDMIEYLCREYRFTKRKKR